MTPTLFHFRSAPGGQRTATNAVVSVFPGRSAREADAVYILGDLFEFWIGDDALSATAQEVGPGTCLSFAHSWRALLFHAWQPGFPVGRGVCQGCGPGAVAGNPGDRFIRNPDPLAARRYACAPTTSNTRLFASRSRNPAWQAGVLALSIEERLQLAIKARDASMQHTGTSSMEIMDVNPEAVQARL